jgi:hypothetical protein
MCREDGGNMLLRNIGNSEPTETRVTFSLPSKRYSSLPCLQNPTTGPYHILVYPVRQNVISQKLLVYSTFGVACRVSLSVFCVTFVKGKRACHVTVSVWPPVRYGIFESAISGSHGGEYENHIFL